MRRRERDERRYTYHKVLESFRLRTVRTGSLLRSSVCLECRANCAFCCPRRSDMQQQGHAMPQPMYRSRPAPEIFAPDERPGADTHVYCKGCGQPLDGHPRRLEGRAQVTVMMCGPCRRLHGHQLVPASSAPSFCYRCGGPDATFVSVGRGTSPTSYRICPRCVPDRAARYRRGDFERPPPPVEGAENV